MPTIAKDVEDKIVRKAGSNCPRCGMVCVDVQGFINLSLSPDPKDIKQNTGDRITAAAQICGTCGYISFHDMETLMRE
jgi:ribosomal protein S27AE